MSALIDKFGMEGSLSIYIQPKGSSEKILFFRGINRITNKAREHLLRLVVENPSSLTPNPIVGFRIGDGGVGQSTNGTEVALYNEIDPTGNYPTTVGYTLIDSNMVAEYTFELTTDDANGYNISEVGLFAANPWMGDIANGYMFNIKTFPELIKTASFSVSFVWRINFSGAAA